jgi:hypothetical protein
VVKPRLLECLLRRCVTALWVGAVLGSAHGMAEAGSVAGSGSGSTSHADGSPEGSTAGSLGLCAQGLELSAAQHDRRLRLVARLRQELDASGAPVALIARSGVDLARFALRFSHTGVALRDSPNTPWSVRQLYYACDEGRPRLFDQGLAGFLLAADDAPSGHVSLVLLPPAAAQALATAALDRRLAMRLLADTYSANAHAFSTRYQNCNQWVAEVLAAAWGGLGSAPTREQAQAWLAGQHYAPHRFEIGSRWLLWLARLLPLLHEDDHPAADRDARVFRVSMPVSLEAFVQRTVPGARRIELCHDDRHIVVHHGWQPLGPGCEAGPDDQRIPFETPRPDPDGGSL